MLKSAFSLVELLVVIAVIAVIAAIAIPNIANITQSADQATKVRNAQNVASTWNNYVEAYYASASAYPSETTVAGIITSLNAGVTVTNTRLSTTNTFRLPGITSANVATNKLSPPASGGGQMTFLPDNP